MMQSYDEVATSSFALRQYRADDRVEIVSRATGDVWPVRDDELDLIMIETWLDSSSGPLRPHCQQCDDLSCTDALLPPGAEGAYLDFAGPAPASGSLRHWWEAKMVVWCRAWRAALNWLGLAT